MTTIVEGLPKCNPTPIPFRPQDGTITMLTFITTNKMGTVRESKRVFIGRMDTEEEVRKFADSQFSDFVTIVTLKTIQFYTLECSTDVYSSVR